MLSPPDLADDPGNQEDTGQDEERDHSGTTPGIVDAAPLQCEQKGHRSSDEHHCTDGIEALDLAAKRKLPDTLVPLIVDVKQEYQRDDHDAANRKVNVEAC